MKKNPLLILALALSAGAAHAQTPAQSQPLQLVVPFAAGGAVDSMARSFAKGLAAARSQPVIAVNREGAGGTIGFWQVARGPANGQQFVFGPSTPVTAGVILSAGPKYDQFLPVCQTHENVMVVVVRRESPIQSIRQLLELAKSRPGQVTYGHAGTGTVPHLSMENFAKGASVGFTPVPYKGDPPMVTDLLGGTIDFGVSSAAAGTNNRLRVLGVFAAERLRAWPDAPVMADFGRVALAPGLNGLWAPKGTPPAVVAQLEKECAEVVRSSEFRETAANLSQQPAFLGSAQYLQRVAADYAELAKTIELLQLK